MRKIKQPTISVIGIILVSILFMAYITHNYSKYNDQWELVKEGKIVFVNYLSDTGKGSDYIKNTFLYFNDSSTYILPYIVKNIPLKCNIEIFKAKYPVWSEYQYKIIINNQAGVYID